MKRYSLYMMSALALAFVACSDDNSTGLIQTNPQEPIMSTDAVTAAPPAATATAVSLADYNTEAMNGLVPVLDITKLQDFPEYYSLEGVMSYSVNADFTKSKNLNLTTDGTTLYAKVGDWETAHLQLYSKNPRATESYVRFELYAVNGTSVARLSNGDSPYFADHKITVTPLPATVVIEDSYSLIGDVTESMVPANPNDVYDPPYFTGFFEVPQDGKVSFQIQSESGKIYGQDASVENGLALNGDPITLSEYGPHIITVNMEDLTYTLSFAFDAIYAYGSQVKNGYKLTTNDFVTYSGFAGLNLGYYRLADGTTSYTMRWGQAIDENEAPIEGKIMLYSEGQPESIKVGTKGCYFVSINLSALTYSNYYVESFGLCGQMNNWEGDIELTHTDKYFMVWKAENVEMKDGTMFKIRANGVWDINLGNNGVATDFSDLVEHGGDLEWSLGDGTFDITLDLSTVPYKMTAVKK